jgi:branched-chain amino acid transport system substrate-binding protein
MGTRLATVGVLAVLALALTAAGCGSGDGDPSLTVYLSAPLKGPSAADGRDVADGARTALDDAGGEAAGTPVKLVVLSDAGPDGADAARAGANARTATEDSTAIAYIGELDSGTTRTSLPITNEAGMLQVSAGASATDLTRAAPGSDQIPDVQPSGSRTFGRVIPSDVAQGAAAAGWMKDSGDASVALVGADGSYGDSLVDGLESVSGGPSVVAASGSPAAIFVASDRPDANILDTGGEPSAYGADAQITGDPPRTALPPGSRLVSGAMAPSQLPGEAVGPGRLTAYGYEAMSLVLDSIERADDPLDRSSVTEAFFATTDRDSVLGTYSIDDVGDTTLDRVGAYVARSDGTLEPMREPLTIP